MRMEEVMGIQEIPDISTSPIFQSSQPPAIRIHHSKILALFRALDSFLVLFMLWVTLSSVGMEWTNAHTLIGLCAVIIFGFFAEGNEVYYQWGGYSTINLATRLVAAWTGTAIIIMLSSVVIGWFNDVNLRTIFLWLIITPIVIVGFHWARRILLTKLRAKPSEPRRIAIVGVNHLGMRLIKSMQGMPWLGYRVVGYYDDRKEDISDLTRRLCGQGMPIIGDLDQLYEDAREGRVDSVFITLPLRAELRMRSLITRLADTTISAYLIPDVFSFDLLHSRLTCIKGIPALSIYDSPMVDNGWAKRLEDILIASGMLIALAIPMLVIAVGVKLSSPGPIIFKQNRYGMRGERIKVWKFRSMSVCEDGDKFTQATRGDPRVTAFGAFIRRTSLDELPQIFNVLGGTMSLVGPRPHAVAQNEYYRGQIKGYMLRHKVKPGITGLAQINGFRGETETLDKMSGRIAYDLDYIRNWSLLLDLKILWLTLFKGFVGQQAY
jgi:putative colanic acid biosynthesis UDP-glucose lipid carrier transferase